MQVPWPAQIVRLDWGLVRAPMKMDNIGISDAFLLPRQGGTKVIVPTIRGDETNENNFWGSEICLLECVRLKVHNLGESPRSGDY